MLKVFGFVRRNPRLTHDEYRAAHVGYHNSFGRRLNNIRGYLLNVRANRPLAAAIGADRAARIQHEEPEDFDTLWDGWGQLMFDRLEDYLGARSPAHDKPGPDGLEDDPMVGRVGGDFEHLYAGSPFQFHVDEYVVKPVVRPERKLFKVTQFAQRTVDLPDPLFRAYWNTGYAASLAQTPACRGCVVNLRTDLDVMTHFFAPDAEGFTPEGTAVRERFYGLWDGMAEYWFDSPATFADALDAADASRSSVPDEDTLFTRSFYREVDETVAVLPNRRPAPPYYHR